MYFCNRFRDFATSCQKFSVKRPYDENNFNWSGKTLKIIDLLFHGFFHLAIERSCTSLKYTHKIHMFGQIWIYTFILIKCFAKMSLVYHITFILKKLNNQVIFNQSWIIIKFSRSKMMFSLFLILGWWRCVHQKFF